MADSSAPLVRSAFVPQRSHNNMNPIAQPRGLLWSPLRARAFVWRPRAAVFVIVNRQTKSGLVFPVAMLPLLELLHHRRRRRFDVLVIDKAQIPHLTHANVIGRFTEVTLQYSCTVNPA